MSHAEEELDRLGLLAGLGSHVLDRIAENVREIRLTPGTSIFDAGDPGDALYIVRSGLVDVLDPSGRCLTTVGPGEALGELSLVTGRPRTAGAASRTGVTLWRLDHAEFVALIGTEPEFGAAVARIVSERLRTATGRRTPGRVVAVLGPHASSAAQDLARACSPMLAGEPLVLEADTSPGAEVAAQAVRASRERPVVFVASDPLLPELRTVVHTVVAGSPPDGFDGPTHPLPDTEEATAALARTICGRRVGLALGSGGVRGFAHAGILSVLTEESIPIDVVSGASAGSVAAALFLTGMDPRDVENLAQAMNETLTDDLPTFSLTPKAILAGRRLVGYLRERLGPTTRIEHLPKPFVVAATDLDTREARHLDRGLLADAVAASSAVPGVFPPVEVDGHRLVDGGVSDPVPVGALRERGADIVVAVNVMTIGRTDSGTSRFRLRVPEVIQTLLVGLDTLVTQIAAHACTQADLVVSPEPEHVPLDEPAPSVRYMLAGEAAMRAALPALRELLGP